MGYWKRLKEAKARHEAALAGKLQEAVSGLGRRWKLEARIEQANNWCKEHPKRTMAIVTMGVVLIGAQLVANFNREKEAGVLISTGDFVNIGGIIGAVRSNNEGKEELREKLVEIVMIGNDAVREIDSLMALPSLTHDDSVRVWAATQRLKIVNDIFDENKN